MAEALLRNVGTRRLWERIRPKISQYTATRGRPPTSQQMTAWIEAELNVEARRAMEMDIQTRGFAIQERELDIRGRAAEAQAEAATMQGIGQLAVGASELARTGVGKAAIGGVRSMFGGGAPAAPTIQTAVGRLGIGLGAGATIGAGVSGVATAPAYVSATGATAGVTLGAPSAAAITAPTLEGVGAVSATPAAPAAGVTGFLAPAAGGAIGAMAGRALEETSFGEITPWGGQTISGVAGGAAGGFLVGGPVGALVGGVVGLVTGGTIICSELHRQGYLSVEVVYADHEYRVENISEEAYKGYLKLAKPVVQKMQTSEFVTKLIAPFGCATAHEMASRVNSNIKGSWLGKCILAVGLPICKLVSKLKRGDN